uniref:Uncharacterized protein n=1 Tax=Solanum lycopersicum TaxID=4081 RepID=K4D7V3_SOLLC
MKYGTIPTVHAVGLGDIVHLLLMCVDLPPHYMKPFKLCDLVVGEHFSIFAASLKTTDRVVTKELDLPVRDDVPLINFIRRLDPQKGLDLIVEEMPWMIVQSETSR